MGLRKDIWRCAIVEAPLATIWARGSIAGLRLHWLPDEGGARYLADPFGLWHKDHLTVFAEAYDHSYRHGTIHALIYDAAFQLVDRGLALREPWHLSYPHVFADDGEVWMLPEASHAGRLTLYRSTDFPFRWEPAAVIDIDGTPVDATPLRSHDGWWLFYGAGRRSRGRASELRCAFADRLTGPWWTHPAGPLASGSGGARPGGTAIDLGGNVVLPVQDCSATYGGSIRALFVTKLDRRATSCVFGPRIAAPPEAVPYTRGLHTLSAAGDVTLVDMKRQVLALRGFQSLRRQ